MDGEFCIYLPLDTYLAEWFVFEHGGNVPVRLIRGSVESKILKAWLIKKPEGVSVQTGGESMMPVAIPSFRSHPPGTYNYLPRRAKEALLSMIRCRFDLQLWEDLHTFEATGRELKDLIYAWLEAHGMEQSEKNWFAVDQRYRRLRNKYKSRERAKSNYRASKKCD